MADRETAWQDECPSLVSRLVRMWRTNLHTDVNFDVGSEDTIPFSAHRIILASGSPVFETMFYGSCPEVGDLIRVPDVDPIGFDFMLRYLYEDHKTFNNEEEVCLTLVAAEKYMITGLGQLCHASIEKINITAENIWMILEFSQGFHLASLKKRCLSFFEDNAKESFRNSCFLTASQEAFEMVLSRPLLRIDEIQILDFIADWAENQTFPSTSHRQNALQSLLSHIHFPSIEKNDFNSFVQRRRNIFTSENKMNLMTYFLKPERGMLPPWCCLDGPRSGLVEKVSDLIVPKQLKSIPYTSVVSWFECQYRLELDMGTYRDVQGVSLKWLNKPEDVPLFCDITLTWGRDSSQINKSIEKRSVAEELNIDIERQFLNSSSCTYTFKIKVQFKYPLKLSFLDAAKPKIMPVKCVFQRAFGVTQWKKKVIFTKAHCVSNINLIRWKKQRQNTSGR